MFQFGEILTLTLGLITVVYVLTNRPRICAQPMLRPFVMPVLILMVAFVSTVVEGVFIQGDNIPWIVFGQESIPVAYENLASESFNLVEHTAYTVAAIWLLAATWRGLKRQRGAPA